MANFFRPGRIILSFAAAAACFDMGWKDKQLAEEMARVQPPIAQKYIESVENAATLQRGLGALFSVLGSITVAAAIKGRARPKPPTHPPPTV